jgi:hypothetical protein
MPAGDGDSPPSENLLDMRHRPLPALPPKAHAITPSLHKATNADKPTLVLP